MIIGDPNRFAVESSITTAYSQLSQRALGFFVVHIRGIRYGIHAPDATLLACSLDEVRERVRERGNHTAPFAIEPDAAAIADAYRFAIYAPDQEGKTVIGLDEANFRSWLHAKQLKWIPDGDEAFDDGSFVLQFDIDDKVRLISFKTLADGYAHNPETLADLWISAEEFYGVLEQWSDAFEAEWQKTPKAS